MVEVITYEWKYIKTSESSQPQGPFANPDYMIREKVAVSTWIEAPVVVEEDVTEITEDVTVITPEIVPEITEDVTVIVTISGVITVTSSVISVTSSSTTTGASIQVDTATFSLII
jgi:hypothetical protein